MRITACTAKRWKRPWPPSRITTKNRENYDALLAKLMARQKKTDTLVCAVLCIVAFILGVYTSTAGGIM